MTYAWFGLTFKELSRSFSAFSHSPIRSNATPLPSVASGKRGWLVLIFFNTSVKFY